ncbi:hypothetical protein AAF712_015816, partial [Marasmius tenuissimus]
DLIEKSGTSFDDTFLWNTISPNVNLFLYLKKQFEVAYNLWNRSNAHTSPHLQDEYQMLLSFFAEEDIHTFIPKHSFDHATVNSVDCGYSCYDDGLLNEMLGKHTAQINVLQSIDSIQKKTDIGNNTMDANTAEVQEASQPPVDSGTLSSPSSTSSSVIPASPATSLSTHSSSLSESISPDLEPDIESGSTDDLNDQSDTDNAEVYS